MAACPHTSAGHSGSPSPSGRRPSPLSSPPAPPAPCSVCCAGRRPTRAPRRDPASTPGTPPRRPAPRAVEQTRRPPPGRRVKQGGRHEALPLLRAGLDRGPPGPRVLPRLAAGPLPNPHRPRRRGDRGRVLRRRPEPVPALEAPARGRPPPAGPGLLRDPVRQHLPGLRPLRGRPLGARGRRSDRPGSDAHELVMSLYGGMSKGERNRIKIRVRSAMAAQAQTEGRYLGGRPPYGYRLADAGPHPNPGKASHGQRLRRLEVDPTAAPVVERIFTEYLAGRGLLTIAERLTREDIPSPSAHDPARNRHRLHAGGAWSKAAIRAILTQIG